MLPFSNRGWAASPAASPRVNAGVSSNGTGVRTNATSTTTNARPPVLQMYACEVVHVWPHDRGAFTQGLVFHDGFLLESTGLKGRSSLRKVELSSGRVLRQIDVPQEYFAEGLAVCGSNIFQLTWQDGKCFVYDLGTFRKEREFTYPGEGWGLTTDGQSLIISDGTERLRFLDPKSFAVTRTISVRSNGHPIIRLNELEYVKEEIFANIWGTDVIARINPTDGDLLGLIDCTGLLPRSEYDATTDVLNGIAYDAATGRLFLTGKHWPKLFEVNLKPKAGALR